MSDWLAVILASGDPKVLEMGLIYARNAAKQGWMSDVKLHLFGPSEVTIAADPVLQKTVKEIISEGTSPQACKRYSDEYNATELLTEIGCHVAYIGAPLSEAVREGYAPMAW